MNYSKEILFKKKPLVILTGPTAVGKTELSIDFAKTIGGEIISADSMQVYRGMDIGSAKIREEEKQGVPHYLLDILEPEEEFHVQLFQKLAKEAVETIYSHGKIPIVTGGTGFYIQALLYDIDFTEETDDTLRKQLEKEVEEKGEHALHERLREVDPESAEIIHENNRKRVIRALEFYESNGYPLSEHNKTQQEKTSPYLFRYYVLTLPREKLYARIEKRVNEMVEEGLVDEVTHLKERGLTANHVSMQGLGYKEILAYLNDVCTLEDAVAKIKLETRHFAKRQLTWFRREKEVTYFEKENFEDKASLLQALFADFEAHIGRKCNEQ